MKEHCFFCGTKKVSFKDVGFGCPWCGGESYDNVLCEKCNKKFNSLEDRRFSHPKVQLLWEKHYKNYHRWPAQII